ncbi:hypothetical protein QBC43DRAFT_86565 [Cladorrhinum sp. PSN259]|nr:hypothetical protein QBC43DRAFT_86565 [Cladorrhinum sp. PSN259]
MASATRSQFHQGTGTGTGTGGGGGGGGGGGITPAQLGFLAIYNPSLSNNGRGGGEREDALDDQIVYYASVHTQSGRRKRRDQQRRQQSEGESSSSSSRPTDGLSREERNERLRQIGLAQGMVEFSRGFSGGRSVDSIETDGRRIVVHELEPGWWVLASIDLTKLPSSNGGEDGGGEGKVEYSSREVKPVGLLLQDLLRAHAVFLLHHDSSLSALFVRAQRTKFVALLGRYWDGFLSSWNVLLHGNPAVNVFGGIKIAACGELGIGVGEEERGSGEREVLEGLVGRVDGLVDLVVGRYGEKVGEGEGQWLGTGSEVGGEDGAVFLGVGNVSRHSLRAICWWMEDMYCWGQNAYGVMDSPTATRSQLRRRRAAAGRRGKSTAGLAQSDAKNPDGLSPSPAETSEAEKGVSGMNNLLGYLTLGYGTSWSLSSSPSRDQSQMTTPEPSKLAPPRPFLSRRTSRDVNTGHFLIGLIGDIDNVGDSDDPESPESEQDAINSRTLLRTLMVELEEEEGQGRPESRMVKDLGSHDTELASTPGTEETEGHIPDTTSTTFDSQDRNKSKKLRVVVYVNRPFIYVFLFQLRTQSLALEGLYKSLHTQLAPLHRPLLLSTQYRPERPDVGDAGSKVSAAAQIYDLVWDPVALSIHSTVPNIPEPHSIPNPVLGSSKKARNKAQWSRVEALNTHNQILNVIGGTRPDKDGLLEFERTCKTSRGWWIVWTRILEGYKEKGSASGSGSGGSSAMASEDGDGDDMAKEEEEEYGERKVVKEILLIRKAGDGSGHGGGGGSLGAGVSAVVASATGGAGSSGGGWADGASRLAQGIGVDTRRYIEGLLSMNR